MAECPVCNSRLFTENAGIPFINFRKVFGCDACGWRMDVDEVHKRGGLTRIAIDIASEKSNNKEEINDEEEREEKTNWEKIDRLPNWAFNKMKHKKTNQVNGEHYSYKKEGNNFYRKLK